MRDPKEDNNGGTEKNRRLNCVGRHFRITIQRRGSKALPQQSVVALPDSCDLEDHRCQHDRIVITFHLVEITQRHFSPF